MSNNSAGTRCRPANLRRASLQLGFIGIASLHAVPANADHGVATVGQGGAAFLTASGETMPKGTAEFGVELQYANNHEFSDAELTDLAGQHIHAHSSDYGIASVLSISYGVTGHFSVSANLPYISRRNFRAGEHYHGETGTINSAVSQGDIAGLGDVSLVANWQFAHSHETQWGASLIGGIKLPTGRTEKRSEDGDLVDIDQQPGSGSFDLLLGFAGYKRLGDLGLQASLIRQFTSQGAQSTELGNKTRLGLASTWQLNPRSSASKLLLVLEAVGDFEGKNRSPSGVDRHSGSNAILLAPGLRWLGPNEVSLGVSLAIPVWQNVGASHPERGAGFRMSMTKGF